MEQETQLILKRLDEIKTELDYIKENMVDKDTILTHEDVKAIEKAENDLKQGKTKRL